jgi:hypothetical protein
LNLDEATRRMLLERAAEQTIATGRRVSASALARELLRAAVQHRGEAA